MSSDSNGHGLAADGHGNERRTSSISRGSGQGEDGDVVARIQNATQNVMGRISGMGRMSGSLGGIANKFGGGILKF